jgi:hypothetical protein
VEITKVTFLDDELYIDHVCLETCNTLQTSLFCFVLFFFQFCDLATVVMRSQEELAKFGYRLKRKVEIVRIMQYFSELEPIV